ncbi:PTS mannitol transporter subunit IICBA [Kocuria rosea]|jgi:PTS system mannitol-specific IIC component|uniref:PTS mannitol transporter subunit IICBA n=1 Tax=Kocuria TaxID=57493 RepID=UPI0004203D95|nr:MULTISPECIES: PTS mannitol transporter subunit IICBA [Kocuria]MCC5784669.1 PTS mannitol transporter subunit IICBA [Kocuria sp. CCUG 69068]EYT51743.1 PTS mannose transporter subunit IIA [Kocuria sp. UCD-OTCP]MEB2526781.1 PTS mannitol transporter subunit IICBA [Kocuria rosea]MEB2619565.1 PTS mannitol transporter subunit IICBA [Kocuria rosea]PAU91254.1 PTS mannitol transporter subunit IICBA [Kocuria sp. WN036]
MATATTSETTAPAGGRSTAARAHVQRFGTFLSGMIMPNIGAFIAWGLITAFFIEAGFTPFGPLGGFGENAEGEPYTGLVGPMITYLLPLLIAYTGGRMVYDVRGGVVGAIATMGVIVGTDIPMFIGAMLMGPLTAWVMKKVDAIWDGKIKPGFEMLVNNFSAGILAAAMAIFGFFLIGPAVLAFSNAAASAVDFLVTRGLLPLTSILIEPAKVLFLNNAINHGILTPLGTAQALEEGKSILFLLEANPGPGLGILLAYTVFGRGAARASAPGAALIHFVGGIHEIYFPYVLMKPALILAAIAGGMTGIFTLTLFDAGLRAPAAPGSIIAIFAQATTDSYVGVALAVTAATAVSFFVASIILKASKDKGEGDLTEATSRMEGMKGKKSSVSSAIVGTSGGADTGGTPARELADGGPVQRIVFACDAGMGSSAMGASVLRNKVKAAGFADVKVTNAAIANLTDDFDIVVTHQDLATRARPKVPSAAVVTVDNFMGSPRYDEIVEAVQQRNGAAVPAGGGAAAATAGGGGAASGGDTVAADPGEGAGTSGDATILTRDRIVMDGGARNAAQAIDEAGGLLVAAGAVTDAYVASMHEREESVSTFMGNGLAIPHGTNQAKDSIRSSALSVVRYPEGLDWNGKPVTWVIGIAGKDNEHLAILSRVAKIFGNKEKVRQLDEARTADEVLDLLGKVND